MKPKRKRRRKQPHINDRLAAIRRFDRQQRAASMAYSVGWLEGRSGPNRNRTDENT